jgi:autotransporter-associated beta strand protein
LERAVTLQLGGTSSAVFDVSTLGAAAQYRRFDKFNILDGANWTLSGISTYTGATNVNAGTLSVNGSIASSSLTTVNAGGTLGGNGIVGNTTINGGTLAPGNSIGLLTVQGNLVMTAASSYMVEVSPANADRTNVTGTATLGGATVKASFAPGTYVSKQYTIVNATGGVSGTFGSFVNTDLPANFKSSLSYDANDAYLNLALNFIPPPGSGLNANQQSAANAIVGFFNANAGIPLVFGGLTPAGLTQISGEVATGSQQTTFNAMNQFVGVMTDPFIAGRGDPVTSSSTAPQFVDEDDAASAYASNGKARSRSERDAYAAVVRKAPVMADTFTQRWSVWAAGYGGSQTTDGNSVLGSNNTRSSIGGVAVGADYRFSPNTLAGFALAGGGTSFSVNGLGSGRSDLFQAGAFVRHTVGAAYLTGALAYGWQDVTTDRTVTIAGADLLRANFNANAFSGRVEGGYRFVTPWMAVGLTPYAAGQFTTFDLPAYAEQAIAGANTFALGYAAKNVTASRSELGIRTDKSFAVQNGIFTLRGRAAWAHDFNPDRNIAATFQTLPGASFVVNGAAQASDAALVTGSAEMKWLNGLSFAATFEGEFSNVTRSYAGKGVARYAW